MKSTAAKIRESWPVDGWSTQVVAQGLRPGVTTVPLRIHRLAWMEFLDVCESNRVLGLLAEAVRGGAIELDDGQFESFETRYRDWLLHDLAVEAVLLRALAELEAADIDVRVLKGVALAHGLYDDPSARVFGDVDLLVPPGEFVRAADVLTGALGARREVPELRPGFDARFGREVLLRTGAVELDLHRTLVDGPFGLWIPLNELFDDPVRFRLGGREVNGLGTVQRFVHACLSAVLGDWPPRLAVLRDVAEMLAVQGTNRLDARSVLDVAGRWRATAAVALAVRRTVEVLGVAADHPLVDWACRYRPTLRDRVLLVAYRGRARGYTSQLLSVLAVRGWQNRWAYLLAITRPSAAYLEARGFRRGDRLRRALGLRRRS